MNNQQKADDLCNDAKTFLDSKDMTKALDYYMKALEIDNHCYEAHVGAGTVNCELSYLSANSSNSQDFLSNAMEHFEKADEMKPLDQKSLLYLKNIYTTFRMSEKVRGINERLHE